MEMMIQPEAAARFVQFVNASPTPFHAVHNAAVRLERSGFKKVNILHDGSHDQFYAHMSVQIREKDDWNLKGGGKYFFIRSAYIVFCESRDSRPQFDNQESDLSVGFHSTFKMESRMWGVHCRYSCRQPQSARETNLQKN
jgi:hypothetical protein